MAFRILFQEKKNGSWSDPEIYRGYSLVHSMDVDGIIEQIKNDHKNERGLKIWVEDIDYDTYEVFAIDIINNE